MFDADSRTAGVHASRLVRKIKARLRRGKDVDYDELKNTEDYEIVGEFYRKKGVNFEEWLSNKIDDIKRKLEKEGAKPIKKKESKPIKKESKEIGGSINMSDFNNTNQAQPQSMISMDMIKQAVNECLEGKCELLNTVKQDLDGLKTQVMDFAKVKETLLQNQNKGSAVEEQAKQPQLDLSQLAEQLKNLENTVKSTANEIPNKTTSEFEGLSKAILNALADIRNEIKETAKKSARQSDDIVPLDKALQDKSLQKKVLSDIENVAKNDKDFFNELSSLIQRCNLGDQEACEEVDSIKQQAESKKQEKEAKPSKSDEILSKIEKELNSLSELKQKIESEMQKVKPEEEETKEEEPKAEKGDTKVIEYSNPLRRLLSGKK